MLKPNSKLFKPKQTADLATQPQPHKSNHLSSKYPDVQVPNLTLSI